ncbi:MAG: Nramp family divalent metal transporter, partial [Candidatus Dojkabacteria bacterium]
VGFGVLWGAILGVTVQYILASESGRYTIATGGSVYAAFRQLSKWLSVWFILSTFFSFAWPGIIGSGGEIFGHILGVENHQYLTVLMLITIGLLLTLGGTVYQTLENFQKFVIIVSIPILTIIMLLVVSPEAVVGLIKGLFGLGDGYTFLPSDIDIPLFLGAIAYAGAGGNLIMSHSFYLQDEGLGMAKNVDSQVKFGDTQDKHLIKGEPFTINELNMQKFKRWMGLVHLEQFITFWGIGLISIIMLTLISFSLAHPYNGADGLNFIFIQGTELNDRFGRVFELFFLGVGVLFLFKTQLGIFETTSRIMTENLQLLSEKIRNKFSRSNIFFFFLWSQILAGILISLANLREPLGILLISTFFSAVSMVGVAVSLLWLMNSKLIPPELRPSKQKRALMFGGMLFYAIFVILTIADLLGIM